MPFLPALKGWVSWHIFMKNTKCKFMLLLLVSVGLIYTTLSYSSDDKTKIPDWLKRIDIGVDVGTGQKPRIYFETVQPLYQSLGKQNSYFIQPRYSLESGDSAYNFGLGFPNLYNSIFHSSSSLKSFFCSLSLYPVSCIVHLASVSLWPEGHECFILW